MNSLAKVLVNFYREHSDWIYYKVAWDVHDLGKGWFCCGRLKPPRTSLIPIHGFNKGNMDTTSDAEPHTSYESCSVEHK